MSLFGRRHGDRSRTKTKYLIEVPHGADECTWVMDEIIGRGPHYQQLFYWGCLTGEHSAWALLDGPGREAVLEEALPPVLRERARVRRVARVWSDELRRLHEERTRADRRATPAERGRRRTLNERQWRRRAASASRRAPRPFCPAPGTLLYCPAGPATALARGLRPSR